MKPIGRIVVLLCTLVTQNQLMAGTAVTFSKDVAPIVFNNCSVCHRPGEVAPFALLGYSDVRKHIKQIIEVTQERVMPPWKAVAEPGTFIGERHLTSEQIALIKRWYETGMVEGDAADLPPAPKFVSGWQLGQPDMIVTMPQEFKVPAEGRDIYRNFIIPVELPPGKYIRALEFRPGNRRVVHHAGLSWDAKHEARALDGVDGEPGFTRTSIGGTLFPGSAGFWVPGKLAQPLPDGCSFAIPAGADVLLQLHLHPSGKPEVERSTIGFYLTSTPPTRPLNNMMFLAKGIKIAPGDKAFRTHQEKSIDSDVLLLSVFPHMHLIGKEAHISAILPDGSQKDIVRIDRWDFNWQTYYEFAKPMLLPKGTKVVIDFVHDNSAENPFNPNNPPKWVFGGEQTTNEMSAAVLTFTPARAAAKVASHNPSTRPTDFMAEAKATIQKYDTDGDGKLSLDELLSIPGVKLTPEQIKAALTRFDRDGDGKLNAEELAAALAELRSQR